MKKDDLANDDVRGTWFYAKTDIACDDACG